MNPLALVIENDGGTRKLLAVLLTRIGFEVDVVPTAADALLLLARIDYDVVFLGVSGDDVLRWLGRQRPTVLERVIVLSSASPAETRQLTLEWPGVRAFRKPFELSEVLDASRVVTTEPIVRTVTVAEQFIRHSVRAGAKAGVVVRVQDAALERVLDFGYAPGAVESFLPLPIDAPLPLCAAVRHARPVWLASVTLATIEYPMLAPVFEKNESRALAVVPLVRDGQVLGAAGWSFREPRLFTERERETFSSIAASLAGSLGEHEQPANRARA